MKCQSLFSGKNKKYISKYPLLNFPFTKHAKYLERERERARESKRERMKMEKKNNKKQKGCQIVMSHWLAERIIYRQQSRHILVFKIKNFTFHSEYFLK